MKKFIKIATLSVSVGIVALLFIIFGTYKVLRHVLSLPPQQKVYETPIYLPNLSDLKNTDSNEFINALMLSPFWYVHNENGKLTASARSYDIDGDSYDAIDDDFFLFDTSHKISISENNNNIRNNGIFEAGGTQQMNSNTSIPAYTYSIEVKIIQEEPKQNYLGNCNIQSHTCTLDVYKDNSNGKIGQQFSSTFTLSLTDSLHLEIKEVSPDRERSRTKKITENISTELLNYSNAQKTCKSLTDKNGIYINFLQNIFNETNKSTHIQRGSGSQGRFTFYGFIKPNILKDSQLPISIGIYNNDICKGECTNSSNRLRKSEYMGNSNCGNFSHFFSIEDNAIYLSENFDSKYGYFSGNADFSAEVSIIQDSLSMYSQLFDGFTGWER